MTSCKYSYFYFLFPEGKDWYNLIVSVLNVKTINVDLTTFLIHSFYKRLEPVVRRVLKTFGREWDDLLCEVSIPRLHS